MFIQYSIMTWGLRKIWQLPLSCHCVRTLVSRRKHDWTSCLLEMGEYISRDTIRIFNYFKSIHSDKVTTFLVFSNTSKNQMLRFPNHDVRISLTSKFFAEWSCQSCATPHQYLPHTQIIWQAPIMPAPTCPSPTSSSGRPFTVLVEGNIGSGKSTFLEHFNKFQKEVRL